MPTVIHCCPGCGAPVEALPSRCAYCGAQVVDSPPLASQPRSRTETWNVVVVGPVGLSNRARVSEALRRFGVSIEDAVRFVGAARTEIVMGTQVERAHAFCMALREAGASVVVEERETQIALEPDRAVVLDVAGVSVARVVVALRAHVDIDLTTARRLVGTAPCALTRPLPASDAHALLDALVAAGAQAHLV